MYLESASLPMCQKIWCMCSFSTLIFLYPRQVRDKWLSNSWTHNKTPVESSSSSSPSPRSSGRPFSSGSWSRRGCHILIHNSSNLAPLTHDDHYQIKIINVVTPFLGQLLLNDDQWDVRVLTWLLVPWWRSHLWSAHLPHAITAKGISRLLSIHNCSDSNNA